MGKKSPCSFKDNDDYEVGKYPFFNIKSLFRPPTPAEARMFILSGQSYGHLQVIWDKRRGLDV